jgi:hypothetical protein
MPWKQKCLKYNIQSELNARKYFGLEVNVKVKCIDGNTFIEALVIKTFETLQSL